MKRIVCVGIVALMLGLFGTGCAALESVNWPGILEAAGSAVKAVFATDKTDKTDKTESGVEP